MLSKRASSRVFQGERGRAPLCALYPGSEGYMFGGLCDYFVTVGSGAGRTLSTVDHLAIPVRDQERSRRFYENYFGFGARPARRYDDGVVMLYNAAGFAARPGRARRASSVGVADALPPRAARSRRRAVVVPTDLSQKFAAMSES